MRKESVPGEIRRLDGSFLSLKKEELVAKSGKRSPKMEGQIFG